MDLFAPSVTTNLVTVNSSEDKSTLLPEFLSTNSPLFH